MATSSREGRRQAGLGEAPAALLPLRRLAGREELAQLRAQLVERGAQARGDVALEHVDRAREEVAGDVAHGALEGEERAVDRVARRRRGEEPRAPARRVEHLLGAEQRGHGLADREAAARDERRDRGDAARVDEAVREGERRDLAAQPVRGQRLGPARAEGRREVGVVERRDGRPVEKRVAGERSLDV